MKYCRLSQEELKLLACTTMLVDHLGAVFFPGVGLRLIGRLSFPIYCFLLAEGVHHTRNTKQYGLRLLVGALLAEIPFDLLFFGRLTLDYQSVMVTLLLGFFYAVAARRMTVGGHRILLLLAFSLMGDLLKGDYGGCGVAMAGLFALTREGDGDWRKQALGLAALSWLIGGMKLRMGPLVIPIQVFSVAALIPIGLYDGSKWTGSRGIQWVFYLFYPVHLVVLYMIATL